MARNPFSSKSFQKSLDAQSGMGSPNQGVPFEVNVHNQGGIGVKAPKAPMSPGRQSSVKKAAAASVAKRRTNAAMKGGKQPSLLDVVSSLKGNR